LLSEARLVNEISKDLLPSKNAEHVFALVVTKTNTTYCLACKDAVERKLWTEAIQMNITLQRPPEDPPMRSPQSESLTSKMIDAITSFSLCRKIIREYLAEDTFVAFDALRTFVAKYDSEFDVDELEKFLYQTGAKTLLLWREGEMTTTTERERVKERLTSFLS
jgi:hypothetical protein